METNETLVLEKSLKSVLKKNCAEPPEEVLRRIEAATGIAVASITRDNSERFLAGLATELKASLVEWKVQFVIGVIRSLVGRHV